MFKVCSSLLCVLLDSSRMTPYQQHDGRMTTLHRWIKTDCGRAKLADLAARPGVLARLRMVWFVLIAALRDWPLPNPDQSGDSSS